MRTTVKLQHLHTPTSCGRALTSASRVEGLQSRTMWTNMTQKATKAQACTLGDVDTLCVHKSPIIINRPALYDLCLVRTHRRPGRGQGDGAVLSGVASGVAWLPLPRKHGGRCMQNVLCRVHAAPHENLGNCAKRWPVSLEFRRECTFQYLAFPMGSLAGNAIGFRPAPLRATLAISFG